MKATLVHALFAGSYAFTPCDAFMPRAGLPSISSKVRVALPGFSSGSKYEKLVKLSCLALCGGRSKGLRA